MKLKQTNNFIDFIKDITKRNLGINLRKLSVMNIELFILYIPQITDKDKLSNNIIKPILQYNKDIDINIHKIAYSIVYAEDIFIDNDENKILNYILEGKSVIILNNDENYLVANVVKVEKRDINLPEVENTLRGSKDAFTENFDANLSLIRYRIKDENLRIENFKVGKRTKTNVAVIYIGDIANENYVREVKNRLKKINIDGIVESGYIQKFILNNALNLFPQVGLVERSDMAATAILEGKICIVVEGSNIALSTPKTFMEFLDSGDDRYDNTYISVFSKILRIIAINIALTVSSMYVGIVSFHPDILPE
ncbi:GerA spore germination protein [Tepidibacter thalassicus DSM 15285]|uniref:GerA spore germination protein n=1 Tax=Tepidibacter thalassicus DSM 15285 TaxID=1123350 RepID=A0A1M5T907_9FIRM|nr:GerA spore germination protein [Tepidibacter thalassicus DSM 15285]